MNDTMKEFDEIVNRRGSGSYKWDADKTPDLIPLWVADMDFRTAPVIIEALRRRVEHGIFGYTYVGPDYYEALTHWFASRHNYHIDASMVIYTSGVVPALSAIIKGLVQPGEGVIIQPPVYNCFFSCIRNNGCKIVENPLRRIDLPDGEFTYEMDYEHLEQVAADPNNRMLLLCNPHNPAGRAWRTDELSRLAEICARNGVRVVSDEIHCELTRPGLMYTPYGNVDVDVNGGCRRAIVCVSPSKSFNTAGLQLANIVCPDAETREAVDRAININEVCDVNPFGVEALKAAYTPAGAEWLDNLREYLFDNYEYVRRLVHRELPDCPITRMEATYLPWVDVSAIDICSEALEEKLLKEAGVWVNCGEMYGTGGFLRINLACPRSVLAEGMQRLIARLKTAPRK